MHFSDTLFPRLAAPLALALAPAVPAAAQVLYDQPGRPYVENFDHPVLATPNGAVGTLLDWIDNETFRGWHAAYYDGQRGVYDTPSHLFISDGRGRPEVAFMLYRTETARGDGALGSQPSDQRCPGVGSGGIFRGVCLVNASQMVLTRLQLAYRVELYRVSSEPKTPQPTLTVEYRIDGDSLGEGSWNPISDGLYVTPVANSGLPTATNVDGNAPQYATPFSLTASGFQLAPGQRLWIRWFDVNNSGVDHGIGLDDVSITLLP